MVKRHWIGATIAIALVTACTQPAQPNSRSPRAPFSLAPDGNIKIGLLIESNYEGTLKKKIAQLAVGDLKREEPTLNVELVVKIANDPDQSVKALNEFLEQGVHLVSGITRSQDAAAMTKIAEDSDVVMISHSSTSPTLAIPDDNLLRFTPSDVHQARVTAKVMARDEVKCVVSLSRKDIWGVDLVDALTKELHELGIEVAYAYAYDIDFDLSDMKSHFTAPLIVIQDQLAHNACSGKTAIHVAAFDEIVPLLQKASELDLLDPNHVLSNIKWYGSDGFVGLPRLASDEDAANFAGQVKLEAPSYSIPPEKKYVMRYLNWYCQANALGEGINIYLGGLYDSIQVLARASKGAGSLNVDALRKRIIDEANASEGVTGPLALDVYGDRSRAYFDFFGIDERVVRGQPTRFWNLTRASCTEDKAGGQDACLARGGIDPEEVISYCENRSRNNVDAP